MKVCLIQDILKQSNKLSTFSIFLIKLTLELINIKPDIPTFSFFSYRGEKVPQM